MKKSAALLLALILICLLPVGAFADKETDMVPDEVVEYARDNGVPSIKSYMKTPEHGYIGNVFNSAEEIEGLTLGKGYRMYSFDLNNASTLSASAVAEEEWLFSLDDNNGAKVYFGVVFEPEIGSLTYYGAEDASNLSAALNIMERLAAKEGVEFAPIIGNCLSGYVVAHSFESGDRVITVPGSAMKLDESYLKVKGSEELPDFEEYITEYTKSLKPYSDLAKMPTGSGMVELLPRLNGSIAGTAETGTGIKPYLVPVTACAALLVISAAAVLIVLKRKKAQ